MIYKTETEMQIYSKMLTLQADMHFPFEQPLFKNQAWVSSVSVLDFGCGNAHYLTKLATMYPEKTYYGCEIDQEMRAIAKSHTETFTNIHIISPEEVSKIRNIDCFIFRLVLLHLKDRKEAYSLIREKRGDKVCCIVMDADDENFLMEPVAKNFMKDLNSLRSESSDRELIKCLRNSVIYN